MRIVSTQMVHMHLDRYCVAIEIHTGPDLDDGLCLSCGDVSKESAEEVCDILGALVGRTIPTRATLQRAVDAFSL